MTMPAMAPPEMDESLDEEAVTVGMEEDAAEAEAEAEAVEEVEDWSGCVSLEAGSWDGKCCRGKREGVEKLRPFAYRF